MDTALEIQKLSIKGLRELLRKLELSLKGTPEVLRTRVYSYIDEHGFENVTKILQEMIHRSQ